jgi:hypothetical protein
MRLSRGRLVRVAAKSMSIIEFQFDQGSLLSYTITDPAVPTVRITLRKHWNNTWAWWCIRSNRFAGKTPTFLIDKANHYGLTTGEYLAVWSTTPDTDNWTIFDNVTIGDPDITISHNTAFPSGTIYIAAIPMYPFSRTQRKIAEWTVNPLVTETPNTTNKILGYSTARANGDGRTAPILPFYGFKLTSAAANTKNKAILTAGNHPSETAGNYELEGAVDWLLGGSAHANFLLDWFEFYIYPSLNPQGRWGGWFRSGPQDATKDHNRYWNTGGLEDVDAFLAAFTADTGGAIEVGIDYHAWMDNWIAKGYTRDATDNLHIAFGNEMKALESAYTMVSDNTVSMLANVFQTVYSARLSLSSEIGGATTRTPANWKTTGEMTMKVLRKMLWEHYFTNHPDVTIGSRVFNGTTDRIDYISQANFYAHPMTASMWVNLSAVPASTNGYLFCLNNNTNTNYTIVCSYGTNRVSFVLNSGLLAWCDGSESSQSFPIVGQGWVHVLITWTGDTVDCSSVHIYRNGAERTHASVNGYAGVYPPATGTWSIGGKTYADDRNAVGNFAQVRMFDRVLTAEEISFEADGILTTTNGLVSWFDGSTSDLHDKVTGILGVADGTTHATGAGTGFGATYPDPIPSVTGTGSRNFNGTTDRIDWPSVANLKGSAITMSAWVYVVGPGATSDYAICMHGSSNASVGIVLLVPDATHIELYRNGTSALVRFGTVSNLTQGWHHILGTHNGTINDATTVHLYCDGIECAEYTNPNNGAGEIENSGSWSVGGRIYDDLRNFNGQIAQAAVWNRVLTGAEITNLAAGQSPDLAASANLLFYFKGNTESLIAIPGGTGTADGTLQTVGTHNGPEITYP